VLYEIVSIIVTDYPGPPPRADRNQGKCGAGGGKNGGIAGMHMKKETVIKGINCTVEFFKEVKET